MITVAAFVPLFTMQGVEGQIFNPMAKTYGYALFGALIATFTITPVLTSYLLPEHVEEAETIVVRTLRRIYTPILRWSLSHRKTMVAVGLVFLAIVGLLIPRLGTEFLPHLEEGNLWIRAACRRRYRCKRACRFVEQDARDTAASSGSHDRSVAAWPA